jgi:RNA polymerase sigma-70 factor (ECF subfamily)
MPAPRRAPEPLDVGQVHAEQAAFVWRSLYRLGAAASDLPDLTQEVFVVVHRQRGTFDADKAIRPWLWGICLGVVRNYRKRAFRHHERSRALAALDPDKRAVFMMFEVEGMSGQEIAECVGVPLGTVHSRLHAARRELSSMLKEDEKGEER